MKIKSIKIVNILSIESAEVEFDDSGLVLVEGWNHDLGRANGAGKTAIFNALSFGIYDKNPRKITNTEILRRGTKTGQVEIEIHTADDVWTIKRFRPKGAEFHKNGIKQDITQDEWEKVIKLTYDQFLVSIYSAQRSDTRFIYLNDSGKKDFLLRLLDLEKIHELKSASDSKIKEFDAEIKELSVKKELSLSKIDAYRESLVDESVLKSNIELWATKTDKIQEKITALKAIRKPDFAAYSKLEDGLSLKESELFLAKNQKTRLHREYKLLEAKIHSFDRKSHCSECGSFMEQSQAILIHQEEQASIKEVMLSLKSEIDSLDGVLSKENELLNLKSKLRAKKASDAEEYNSAAISISEHTTLLQKIFNSVENAALKLSQNVELSNKIKALQSSVDTLIAKSAQKHNDLEFYKTLSAIYAPTGAQAYVLDTVVDSFNEKVSDYMGLVWPNANYQLNTYKETSKGDITAKFSESLTFNSKDVSVGSLSGGELKALSLCIDFTIIDILQTNFGININPIILDEPFDGLDAVGKEIVLELLENISKDRQILVVDHGSEAKAMFSKTIHVEKRNDISTIKVEV